MNKDQTSTPITDAAAIALHGTRLAPGCIYVKAEDMRNLERQLAESREQRDMLATALRTWQRIAYAGANHEGIANARHQTDAALTTLKGSPNEPR